jgi:hypothetical protein
MKGTLALAAIVIAAPVALGAEPSGPILLSDGQMDAVVAGTGSASASDGLATSGLPVSVSIPGSPDVPAVTGALPTIAQNRPR